MGQRGDVIDPAQTLAADKADVPTQVGDLQFRSWEPGNTGSASSWGVVARNLVEMDVVPIADGAIEGTETLTVTIISSANACVYVGSPNSYNFV